MAKWKRYAPYVYHTLDVFFRVNKLGGCFKRSHRYCVSATSGDFEASQIHVSNSVSRHEAFALVKLPQIMNLWIGETYCNEEFLSCISYSWNDVCHLMFLKIVPSVVCGMIYFRYSWGTLLQHEDKLNILCKIIIIIIIYANNISLNNSY